MYLGSLKIFSEEGPKKYLYLLGLYDNIVINIEEEQIFFHAYILFSSSPLFYQYAQGVTFFLVNGFLFYSDLLKTSVEK